MKQVPRRRSRPIGFSVAFVLILFGCGLAGPGICAAVEIAIGAQTATAGQMVEVPVVVDEVADLAGVKLVLRYDPAQLEYRRTVKTPLASQMLHVVNDRQPGTLILVMAGARGIGGKDIALFTITFQVAPDLAPGTPVAVRITDSQLMSAGLEKIEHSVASKPFGIIPGASNATPSTEKRSTSP